MRPGEQRGQRDRRRRPRLPGIWPLNRAGRHPGLPAPGDIAVTCRVTAQNAALLELERGEVHANGGEAGTKVLGSSAVRRRWTWNGFAAGKGLLSYHGMLVSARR